MFDKSRNWTCVQYYHKLQCACRAQSSVARSVNTHIYLRKMRPKYTYTHEKIFINKDVIKRNIYSLSLTLSYSYILPDLRKLFSHVEWAAHSATISMCVYSYVFGQRQLGSSGRGRVILNIHFNKYNQSTALHRCKNNHIKYQYRHQTIR